MSSRCNSRTVLSYQTEEILQTFSRRNYWLNRKNCCETEMGLVTVFCPLTMTGAGGLAIHTGERRFVVDCKLNPVALVGQVKITFDPERMMVSCGCDDALAGSMTISSSAGSALFPATR